MSKDTKIVTDNFNFNNYTFEDLIESKIYSNYSTLNRESKYQDILNVVPQKNENFSTEYLIKNRLSSFEYIVELYFNRIDDVTDIFEPFNRIGTFDIITKDVSYKMYSLGTESNLVWKASYGNALVGFDLIYDDDNIKKMRLIEAPIDKMHDMPHNISFSKWYGVRNEIEKDMHNYKKMMIYVPNLFISGFQQFYYSSFISFGKVYFKAGPEIIKHKIDISKCCIYDDESVEYSFCKYMNKLDKCSEEDQEIALKSKLNKNLKKMNSEKLNIDSMMKCYDFFYKSKALSNTISDKLIKSSTSHSKKQTGKKKGNKKPERSILPSKSKSKSKTNTKTSSVPSKSKTPIVVSKSKENTDTKFNTPSYSTVSPGLKKLSSIERFADEHVEHFIPSYGSCSVIDKVNGYLYVIGFYALVIYIIYRYYFKKFNKQNN